MANNVRNTGINIYINDQAARDAAARLKKDAEEYSKKLELAREKQKQLNKEIEAAKQAGTSYSKLEKDLKKVTDEIDKNSQALDKNKQRQEQLQKQIDGGVGSSLKQQAELVRRLTAEYRSYAQGTDEAADALEKLIEAERVYQAMQARQATVRQSQVAASQVAGRSGVVNSFLGNLGAKAVETAVDFAKDSLSKVVGNNAKYSDMLADIEKSSGLSTERVVELDNALRKLNTRTSYENLEQIAVGLGQIGEAVTPENVAAIDKIVVALGDEFGGGADEITKSLSILRNNLQDIKTKNYGDDVAKIGNALNVLGAEGLASAPVVTDFANRMAGVAGTFGLSSGQILGTAAAFQELGINVERGSTAFIKILQKIAAEPEKFARVAGLSIKEFTKLVNTDLEGAFIKVAEGAKKAGVNNVAFGKILKELDADGSGAGEVLSKVAANGQLVADKVKLASDALQNTSSITDEFNKKNNNLAAELEKLYKKIEGFFTNNFLVRTLTSIVAGINKLTSESKTATDAFRDQKAVVDNLEKNTVPLINRYDELSKKANELGGTSKLSKDEQLELEKAIKTIGSTIPGAITQFDNYGKAIQISSDKARKFIELNQAILKEKNRDAIKETDKEIKKIEDEIKMNAAHAQGVREQGAKDAKQWAKNEAQAIDMVNKANTMAQQILEKNIELDTRLKGQRGIRAELTGETPEELKPPPDDSNKKDPNAPSPFDPDAEKKQKEYERKLLEFKKKIEDFLFETEQTGNDADKKEIARIKRKYDDLIKEYKTYQKDLKGVSEKQLLDMRDQAVTKKVNEIIEEDSKKEYAASIVSLKAYYDQRKAAAAKDYSEGKITKEQYDEQVIALEQDQRDNLVVVARDYVKSVKDAEKDLAQYTKESEEWRTDNQIKALEKRKKAEEDAAKIISEINKRTAEGDVAAAEAAAARYAPGTWARFKAEQQVMKLQNKAANVELNERLKKENKDILDNTALTGEQKKALMSENERAINQEREKINAEYREKQLQAEVDFWTTLLGKVVSFYSQVSEIFTTNAQIKTNKENQELQRQQKKNDKDKAAEKKLLDSKIITQQQYNKRIGAIDDAFNQQQASVKRKQWERQQTADLIAARISGAQAILSALQTKPFLLGLALAGLAAYKTKQQIDVIKSQPVPEFGKGGKLSGPSHSQGGMPVIDPVTGTKQAEVEGGEVILSKSTVRNNPDLVNRLLYNSMYLNGATLEPAYKGRPYQVIDTARIAATTQAVRHFENGGTVGIANTNASTAGTAPEPVIVPVFSDPLVNAVENLSRRLETPITAKVFLRDIQEAEDKLSNIQSDAIAKSGS